MYGKRCDGQSTGGRGWIVVGRSKQRGGETFQVEGDIVPVQNVVVIEPCWLTGWWQDGEDASHGLEFWLMGANGRSR